MVAMPSKDKLTRHPGVALLTDGRWLVTKTWMDTRTGKRKFKRQIVTGSLDDAQRVRANLRAHASSAGAQPRQKFAPFAEGWLARHRKKVEPSTFDRYTRDVAHLSVEFGDWWVDAVDFDALELWQDEVSDKYAAPTINGWHRTMRLVLDVAVRRHLVNTNPARELSVLPEGRTKGARGTSLTASELRAFVAGISTAADKQTVSPDVGRALHVMAWTGMRIGEVIALRWEDVAGGEFRVEQSVWRGHSKPTKTDDPRRVTIVEPLAAILEEQRRWLLAEQHPGLSSGLVFPASPAQAFAGASRREAEHATWYRSQSTLQEAVRAVCNTAQCPRITPHSLRRTFEDLLREAGVETLVRRAVAGWRSERAQGIYATVKREDRDAAADAVIRLVMG